MTVRCNGGTSSQIPGTAATNVIGAGLITAGLEALAPWLLPVSLLVDAFLVETSSECSTDPPPVPTFDASDLEILALGLLAPTATQTIGKINNLLLNWAWDKYCQCDSGGFTPTAPVPPPAGTGASSANQSKPCFVGAYNGEPGLQGTGTAVSQWPDYTGPLIGTDGRTRVVHFADGSTGTGYGMPAGTTQISYTGIGPTGTGGLSCTGNIDAVVTFSDVNGVYIQQYPMGTPTGVGCNLSGSVTVPTNASFWNAKLFNQSANWGTYLTPLVYNTNVWCGGGGPGVTSNCCPPDPSIALAIQNILQILQNPPSATPKPYVKGATHVGLVGEGTLTVSGLFGVQLQLTTGVPTAIQFPGVPPYERSVGWVSMLTADGMIDESRITRQNQVWASALAPYATTIGYHLNPGFTMTLTELTPGT